MKSFECSSLYITADDTIVIDGFCDVFWIICHVRDVYNTESGPTQFFKGFFALKTSRLKYDLGMW